MKLFSFCKLHLDSTILSVKHPLKTDERIDLLIKNIREKKRKGKEKIKKRQ
jgi:hypothetical protein